MWETLQLAENQNETWKCNITECTKEFKNQATLTKQIYKTHEKIPPKDPKQPQKCPQCQQEQKDQKKLLEHLEIIQPRGAEACTQTQELNIEEIRKHTTKATQKAKKRKSRKDKHNTQKSKTTTQQEKHKKYPQ